MKNIFKISVVAFAMVSLSCFGMQLAGTKSKKNGFGTLLISTEIIDLNKDTWLNKDLIIGVAAIGDSKTKNSMRGTCKYLNTLIMKSNLSFVSLPRFAAAEKDLNDIVMFYSWHGKNPEIVESISKKMNSPHISFPFGNNHTSSWSIGLYECSWPCTFECGDPGKLNRECIQQDRKIIMIPEKMPLPEEKALLFAALCKDIKAVEAIGPKIKEIYQSVDCIMTKMELQQDLLYRLIEQDDEEAFRLIVKQDPYGALNLYLPGDKKVHYEKTYLDILKTRYVHCLTQSMKDKYKRYIKIYEECGGKSLKELHPKENCVIS